MSSAPTAPLSAATNFFAQLEAERPALIAAIAARLDGWAVPGGDVAKWLAGVPVLLIAECIQGSPASLGRRLFRLVGEARAAGASGLRGDVLTADHTNLIRGATAELALRAWSACILARLYLGAGHPADAVPVLNGTAIDLMLAPQGARMPGLAARIQRLQNEAGAALAQARAHEVA